ncbi:MAG: putative bifunctional diguanylate cyclase/phosphodiesterase [Cellulosilyticaceae bacterium]
MRTFAISINRISFEQLFVTIGICTITLIVVLLIDTILKISKRGKNIRAFEEQYDLVIKQMNNKEQALKVKQFEVSKTRSEKKVLEERLEKILEANHQTIYEHNVITGEVFYTDGILRRLGYDSDLIHMEHKWNNLIHVDDIDHVVNESNQMMKNSKHQYTCEYRIRAYDGSYIWIREKSTALLGQDGQIVKVIRLFKDINEIKAYEIKIHKILYHDIVTGLPNRRRLDEVIGADLQNMGWPLKKKAILSMDIDNFKRINDTLGNSVGDQALEMIGKRLRTLVNKDIHVFKTQSDRFSIYLSNITIEDKIELLAKKLINVIREPITLDEGILNLTVSIGISIYPDDGVELNELLKFADIAMQRSKNNGKNSYSFFSLQQLHDVEEMSKVERYLRHALEKKEFVLHYQPKVNLDLMKVVGFEALIRWYNPELGFVSPIRFIKEAEVTGMIIPIGEWVLREACRFIKQINLQTGEESIISVNISGVQLMQDNFVEMVLGTLVQEGVCPKWVRLELTETTMIRSAEVVTQKLQALRKEGIAIALDDFGKEYSSLNYLKQLPLDILKIDKSFIDDIQSNDKDEALVDMVISLGKKMGFEIIAEGVETQVQLEYLYNHDCKNIQGYIFSKPVPAEEILCIMEQISGL